MKVKNVIWEPQVLEITIEDDEGKERTFMGECIIPYHPHKFENVELEALQIFGGITKAKNVFKPRKWTAEGIIEAINRTKTTYELRADIASFRKSREYWGDNGELLYEKTFESETDPAFLPIPLTRGIRIFRKEDATVSKDLLGTPTEREELTILRVVLYYLEEVRVEKWDFLIHKKIIPLKEKLKEGVKNEQG